MASQQSQAVLWNELPPEIVGIILSNLGKHDLLNARLISHTWNDESLKVLRKSSKFTQVLREEKIKEYLLFTTPTPTAPRKFIIPFHLNFNIHSVYSRVFKLSMKTLTSYVESLCQVFGLQCVSTLTLTTDDIVYNVNGDTVYSEDNSEPSNTIPPRQTIKETDLTELLPLISSGLKTLDLSRFNFKIDFLKNTESNQILTFPNLKKLSINTHKRVCPRGRPSLAYISIIENSPNLQDLTLTHICSLEYWPIKFNQLKSLSLDTMLDLHSVMCRILPNSGASVLRELSFRADMPGGAVDEIVVHKILTSVSPTLKSLKFRGSSKLTGNVGYPLSIRGPIPILPHLEHLGLEYNVDYNCPINPEDINLSEETFPSLKSIELPFGFIFTLVQFDNISIQFPNLIKLILRVGGAARPEKYLNGTLEHLQAIFPTPSKLSLVQTGRKKDCVKHLLDRIMRSDWSKNIQEFEMIGFGQDYLGHILEESMGNESPQRNQSDSIKMTNVTTIKLELIEGSGSYDGGTSSSSSAASMPNLVGFGKYFPQLRMIEVSERFFHQRDKSTWTRHIQEFKLKFPTVILYVS